MYNNFMKHPEQQYSAGETTDRTSLSKKEIVVSSQEQARYDAHAELDLWLDENLPDDTDGSNGQHSVRLRLEMVKTAYDFKPIPLDAVSQAIFDNMESASRGTLQGTPMTTKSMRILRCLIANHSQALMPDSIAAQTGYSSRDMSGAMRTILRRFEDLKLNTWWTIEGNGKDGWRFVTIKEYNPETDSHEAREAAHTNEMIQQLLSMSEEESG